MILNPDDFEIGMYLTVLEWKPIQREVFDGNIMGTGKGVCIITNQDNYYKGEVLQIVAINLPYVVCKCCAKGLGIYNSAFDTRRVKFIQLSQEYVKAMES